MPDHIRQVYEQYKHLDYLLTDPIWIGMTACGDLLRDLWQAIKAQIATEDARHCDTCAWWEKVSCAEWGYCTMVERGYQSSPAWLSHWTYTRLSTQPTHGCTEHMAKPDAAEEAVRE